MHFRILACLALLWCSICLLAILNERVHTASIKARLLPLGGVLVHSNSQFLPLDDANCAVKSASACSYLLGRSPSEHVWSQIPQAGQQTTLEWCRNELSKMGFKSEAIRCSELQLIKEMRERQVAILHLNWGHFVVASKVNRELHVFDVGNSPASVTTNKVIG